MMQRERSDVYIIPPNFAKEGTLFSGRIEGRNAFEAAVLFIVLFRILFFIDVSIKLRIYIGIIVILPLTILAVVGVNGESLLSFIIQFIRFGMFVALDFVWTKTKEDRTVEKAVFVDEAWKLLMSNDLAGEYLIEIFKTIRAYGGSAICATQDLADCFAVRDGKLGRGILSNSKTKIVLNMEVSEAERIQEELDLSEAETNSIIHFERGNGLISTNNNNLIVEFKASALEKDLITTDRKDLQELKDRIRKYGTDAYGRK